LYSKFYALELEKRERIINAAFEEFAQNGYDKASTNKIIKDAEISKGSLFNYFKSKKDLYLFLLEYMAQIIDKIYNEIDFNETDLFERLKDIGLIKFKIMNKFPKAFDFLKRTGKEKSDEVKIEIDIINKQFIKEGLENGYQNIDFTKFRDDIDLQKTLDIINWTILSFAMQQADKLNSYEDINMELLEEWDSYFDIMKRCFYKEGEK